ncbi:unnamed protein product [Adineta steineri]|uniref:Nuclear receptor domain-containing protein n=1 Tax=Adineta steineri TaxID=433720 RepID=A0A814SSN5_9BILA|nr:unnamed protein product [Adineta steineri]
MTTYHRKITKRMFSSPLICYICGDGARGINFDVITCMSCKAFFRRNALRSLNVLRCRRKSNCEITIETRKNCPACRLQKCLKFGMKSKLIRLNSQALTQDIQLPRLRPLSLLQNDYSTFTVDHWNLLSNVINVCNEYNIINDIKCLLIEYYSLPVRLRIKPFTALSYMNKSLSTIQTILKRSPYFHSLSLNSRRSLIQNNTYLTTNLNSIFVSSEIDRWNNMNFSMSFNTLLGTDFVTQFSAILKRIDSNSISTKLMLFIIVFSSNCSIVIFNNQQNLKNKSTSIELIQIQNIFVTLLWKYLIYQYGYTDAIRRYCSLIKFVLDILYETEKLTNNEIYHQILNTFIVQTENLLIL